MACLRLLPIVLTACALGAVPASAAAGPLHILVTNDDGYQATGLSLLTAALVAEPDVQVSVVAPSSNQSGTGGRASAGVLSGRAAATKGGYPAYAVHGTPADSVRYALDTLRLTPDLVISGLNNGANLGPIAEFSGTVGAARAAARRGLPALATSQGSGHPAHFADGVAATVAWLRVHRSALEPATVENLNTPTCRYAGKPAPTVRVRAAHALSLDLVRSIAPEVCPSMPSAAAADDVRAYAQGYSTVTPLSVG